MHQNGNLTKSSSFKDYKILNIDQQSQLKQPRASIRSTTSSNILNRTKKFLKGICLTILSGFFFSLTTLVVKYVNKQVSPGTTAGFRYLGIIILAFPLAWESSQPLFGRMDSFIWIALRGLAGGTSVFCRYSALHYMSMADSTIIILSMPVFVFVFARIFLKENFGRYHVLALILSIIGIMFASKMDIIFGKSASSSSSSLSENTTASSISELDLDFILNYTSTETSTPVIEDFDSHLKHNHHNKNHSNEPKMSNQLLGTLYSLGATFIGCFVYIIIRKLKDVDKYVILFNFSIISMIEMIIIDYFFFDFDLPQTGWNSYLLVLIGILSFYAQLLLTRAIQIEEAGVVSVVRTSSEAFFAFFLQITFFGQIPDVFTIIGAILVLSAVFLLSFRKYILGLAETDPLRNRFKFLTK
ncbi:solute carrier family 35-like protein 2 [Sarcoptes scabiei]|nr:solute carrier family 35-like protein 2 [Sarcoptes scabiei]